MSAMDNAHAVVIGIANYLNTNEYLGKLPPTVLKDAQDIYNLLIDPEHCGYPADNVKLLLDDQATQVNIRQTFKELAQNTNQDSTAFFYLSSHGGRIETGQFAGEYLLPVDVVYPPEDRMAETAISGADFTKMIHEIPARKVMVIFDCCHSGGIGEPKGLPAPIFRAGLPEEYYEALVAGSGRVIMASSRSTEYSYVLPFAENSLFTHHFLAGVSGGVASDDGLIHIFALYNYIQKAVTKDQPQQHPRFKIDVEDDFPIALYPREQRGIVPKDAEGFQFDAYISYVDKDPDTAWVWDTLLPRLEKAGLRVAISGDVEQGGVDRVVNIETGIRQSKRTILVLSKLYLAENMAKFESVLGQTMGIQEGTYRLLPVTIEPFEDSQLPVRLSMLTTLNLVHPRRSEREFERLITSLQGPLPRM